MTSRWVFLPYLGIALLIFVAVIEFSERTEERLNTAQTLAETELKDAQAKDAWARYDTAIAACNRGNIVRGQIETLRDNVVQMNVIFAAFFDRSAELRMLAERDDAAREALVARNRIRQIAETLQPVKLINCNAAIQAPFVPRPKTR